MSDAAYSSLPDLRQKLLELELIFKTLPDALIFTDLNRRIRYVNPACARIFGYDPDEMRGKSIKIIYANHQDFVLQGKLRYNPNGLDDLLPYRVEYRRKDGSTFPARALGTRVYGTNNEHLGYVGIIADLTSVAEMETALLESRYFIERIVSTSPVLTWVFDIDKGQTIFVSPNVTEVLGYTQAEITMPSGHQGDRFVHPDDAELNQQHLLGMKNIEDGAVVEVEMRLLHGSGEYHWFRIRQAVFARDAAGQPYQFIGAMEDITARKVADAELNRKRAEFETMFQAIPDAVLFTDATRHILYANPAFTRLFGYSASEAVGSSTAILYADREDFVRLGQKRLDATASQTAPYEIDYRHRDGRIFTAETVRTVVRNAEGDLLGFVAIIRDISERKYMQAELIASEQRLNNILNSLRDIVWSLEYPTGRLIYVNPILEDIYGYPAENFVRDQNFWISCVHPDDRTRIFKIEDQNPPMRGYQAREYRIVRGDGSIRWLSERFQVIFGEDDVPLRVDGVTTDVTGRKAAEAQLQEATSMLAASREALRMLIEQIPVGIQIFDAEGTCIDVNQAHLEIFGSRSALQIIQEYNIFQDPLAVEQGTADAARRALQGETVYLGDLTFRFEKADARFARTSGVRVINVTIFPVSDAAGQVINIVGMNHDVTERREAEEQRLQLAVQTERVRLLEELISDVSHDLKTPLSSLGTSTYLLRRHLEDPKLEKYVERIDYQRERLERLIDDMLTMSRLSQLEDLQFAPTNIKAMLQEIVAQKQPLLDEKSLKLELTCPDDLPPVFVARNEFYRVFENLIENAVNYTPAGGTITLDAQSTPATLQVAVSDTGIGIDPADLPRIFDRFYRADKARSADTGGTGLGLAIVKKILEMHGGGISVVSEPNLGSTFTVYLPY